MPESWNQNKIMLKVAKVNYDNLILAGEFVKGSAVLLCPVDTGNLKGNMDSKMVDDETVRVSNPTEYAVYVEMGTRFQKAQPYLRPALLNNKPEIRRILEL